MGPAPPHLWGDWGLSGWSSTLLSPACSRASLQLTETSSRYARKISGTTALQEALKEKQQHIEQLLAERDLERAEVAKATSHICEVEKEIALLKAQHEQVGERVGVVGSPAGYRRPPRASLVHPSRSERRTRGVLRCGLPTSPILLVIFLPVAGPHSSRTWIQACVSCFFLLPIV